MVTATELQADGTALFSAEAVTVAKVTKNVPGSPLEVDKANAKRIPSFSEFECDADFQTNTKRGDNAVKDSIAYMGDGATANVTLGRFTPDAMAYITETAVAVVKEWATANKDGFIEWGLSTDDMSDMPELVIIASTGSGAGRSGNQHICISVVKVSTPALGGMSDEEWTDFEVEFSWAAPANGSKFYRIGVSESKVVTAEGVLDLFFPTVTP